MTKSIFSHSSVNGNFKTKFFSFIVSLALFFSFTASAQTDNSSSDGLKRVYLGVEVMPTFTKFNVQESNNGVAKTSFNAGFGVGGFLGVNFSSHVGMQVELLYSNLSQKYADASGFSKRINLTYFNIPLLLVLNTNAAAPVNINICAGPQLGINTGSRIKADESATTDTIQAVLSIKSSDIGFAYGAGFDFRIGSNASLGLGFRGVYGLLDVSDKSNTASNNQYYLLDRTHVKTYAGFLSLRVKF